MQSFCDTKHLPSCIGRCQTLEPQVLEALIMLSSANSTSLHVYLCVGEYTSKSKQDPWFLNIFSKVENTCQIVSKLVTGTIIRLKDVGIASRLETTLFDNDKRGLIDLFRCQLGGLFKNLFWHKVNLGSVIEKGI